jgi:hypothetical protein
MHKPRMGSTVDALEAFFIDPFIPKDMSSALLADRYYCNRAYYCSISWLWKLIHGCDVLQLKEMLFLFCHSPNVLSTLIEAK